MVDQDIQDTYFEALNAYVGNPAEEHLAAIAKLGRQLVLADVPPEEVAQIHQPAVGRVARERPSLTLAEMAPVASVALAEILMAYGLVFRERLEAISRARDKLMQSEARFRMLFDHMPSGVVVYQAQNDAEDFIFVDINRSVERIEKVARQDVIGKRMTQAFPAAQGSELFEAFQRVWRSGKSESVPASWYEDQRVVGWRENSVYKLPSGEIVSIFDDVTERVEARQAMQRYNRDLELLHHISNRLTSTRDLEQVLAAVLKGVADRLSAAHSSIWLIDPETGELVCSHAMGPQSAAVLGCRLPPGEGFVGWVSRQGKSLIMSDAQADARHFNHIDQKTDLRPRSVLCVPLRLGEQPLGALEWLDEDKDRYSPPDLALAEQLATTAALAIENARLYGQSQREIAERRQAEEELKQSEARFRSLFDHMPSGVAVYQARNDGEDFITLDINRASEQTNSTGPDDSIGRSIVNLFPAVKEVGLFDVIQRVWATGEAEGYSFSFEKDHHVRWMEDYVYRLPSGEVVAIYDETTERRQAEKELKQYANRLRSLNRIDKTILANRPVEEIADEALRSVADVAHCQWSSVGLFGPEEGADAVVAAVYPPDRAPVHRGDRVPRAALTANGEIDPHEVVVIKDVTRLPHRMPERFLPAEGACSAILVPLLSRDRWSGFLFALGCDAVDFTPERQAIFEEVAEHLTIALERADLREQVQSHIQELEQHVAARTEQLRLTNTQLERAVRLKDEFLATMSHELRTPLNAILGLSEALQEEVYGTLTERQARSLSTIEESGRHLLSLINDILDVSKIGAGKMELSLGPVAVDPLCRASLVMVKQQAHGKSVKGSFSFDGAVSTIEADERLLKQALVNLLSNAVKFTPEGGAIGLEVVGDSERETVNFTVWDTGIGISPEDMAHLFQPFVQLDSSLSRSHSGTGLGLVLVERIADLHGGSVSVQSEPGQGSRFTISLPWEATAQPAAPGGVDGSRGEPYADSRHSALASDKPVDPVRPVGAQDGPVVLLADDNEANASLVSDYLRAHGYQALIAQDGAEAVELARKAHLDVILMDIQMPGMDGIEAILTIRADADLAQTPIIALTALAMPGDRERCLAAGANNYLSKPVSLRKLVGMIQAHIAQQGHGGT